MQNLLIERNSKSQQRLDQVSIGFISILVYNEASLHDYKDLSIWDSLGED
jgi:hypothetical protein